MAMLGAALAGAGGNIGGSLIDQIGGGVREYFEGERRITEMMLRENLDRKTLELKEQLSEKEASKLLELELKKMDYETKQYKDRSGVDIEKYKSLSNLDLEKERIETEDKLKLINATYGGEQDLLKLKSNLLNQQQIQDQRQSYQPTSFTDYNIYPNMGAFGPLNSPLPQYNYTTGQPLKRPPLKNSNFSGHRIEQV